MGVLAELVAKESERAHRQIPFPGRTTHETRHAADCAVQQKPSNSLNGPEATAGRSPIWKKGMQNGDRVIRHVIEQCGNRLWREDEGDCRRREQVADALERGD